MNDAASVPSVDPPLMRPVSSLFAAVPKWWNERRKIVRITGDGLTGFKSEVVKDFDQLYGDEKSVLERALQELADADDTPQEQEYLMQAWTAMAMYLANSDDEDKAAAIAVLQAIGAMINDPDNEMTGANPTQPGAFNFSRRSGKVDGSSLGCPQCDRAFATTDGMSNHIKTVHSPTPGEK
jgi:hypothetical protein